VTVVAVGVIAKGGRRNLVSTREKGNSYIRSHEGEEKGILVETLVWQKKP